MSDIKLTADETEVLRALQKIEDGLLETSKRAQETGQNITKSFKDSEEDAKRAADALLAYNSAQDKLKAGAQERLKQNQQFRKELELHRQAQERLRAEQERAAKKNVEVAKTIQVNSSALKDNKEATEDSAKASGGLSSVLGATPWGRVALAIGGVIGFLSKFQEGMDFVSKITASVSAGFTVLIERAVLLGKSFAAFVGGDAARSAELADQATGGFIDAMGNAVTGAFELEGRIQALRDAQLDASVSAAKLAAESERQQAISNQQTKTFDERIKALRAAIELEGAAAKIRVGFAEQEASLAREQFALSSKGVADKEVLIQKELKAVEERNNADKIRIDLLGQLNALEKERADFIVKGLEQIDEALKKIQAGTENDPIEQELIAVRKKYEGLSNVAQEALNKLVEIEKLRPLSEDELQKRQELQDAFVAISESAADAEIQVLLEAAKRQNEIEEEKTKAKKAQEEKRLADSREALQKAFELENLQIDIAAAGFDNIIALMRSKGAEEAEIKQAQLNFDGIIKARRIKAEIEYQRQLLDTIGVGEEATAEAIKARIKALETILAGLNIEPPKSKDGKERTIYDLLGISFDDEQAQQAFEQIVGNIRNALGEITAARVREAEAAVQAANEKVRAAENALKEEEALLKQGVANNTDLRKLELEEAKKAREAALKEETRAKRAQLALDTATQISSLATATANIFKGFSSFPLIGQILAVAAVAAMFGAFAKAKADAIKATAPPKLRRGAKIQGPSHEGGGVLVEAEGGEQFVGVREAAGQDLFFDRMRKGKYKGVDLARALERHSSDPIGPLAGTAGRVEALRTRREVAEAAGRDAIIERVFRQTGQEIVEAIQSKPDIYPWKDGYKEVKRSGAMVDKKTVLPAE